MTLRRFLITALVCAVALAAAAQERNAPSAGSGGQFQISGTVVNAINDQPLAGAYVTITAVQGAAARTVMTAADGAFRFDGVPANTRSRPSAAALPRSHTSSTKAGSPPRLRPARLWIPATSSSASCPMRPFPGALPTSRAMRCVMRASCSSASK